MNFYQITVPGLLLILLCPILAFGQAEEFSADQLMEELEKQLELSNQKLSEMRPALESKSDELKKSIQQSVEEGFMDLEKMSKDLESASSAAIDQMKDALNSDEAQKLKRYMENIDREAIEEVGRELAAALAEILKLTEAQLAELKPVLEDSFRQLGDMLRQLAEEGEKSAERFQQQYEELNQELKQKLEDQLDSDQMKTLEENREELEERISSTLA